MKRTQRLLSFVLILSLLLASWPIIGFAQSNADETGVGTDFGPTSVTWSAPQGSAGFVLVVSGPEGYRYEQNFPAGAQPVFEAVDATGAPLADGLYKYELTPIRYDVTRARLAGDDGRNPAETRELAQSQVNPGIVLAVVSGAFTIQNSAILNPLEAEESSQIAKTAGGADVSPADISAPDVVLTTSDGVIRNSLCTGFDCPNSPTFGDSTILLMENNTRLKFGDTSTGSFPANDWEIEANSANSGGASYLGFNDCGTADNDGGCATDLVFAVEAGARSSALYVESDGDVGLGTSNPVLDLHMVTGNTPSIRLDQDGSSGFTSQVWDMAGNEANFFVRDVTNGSKLPFRIRPGAPTSSIDINASGNVGMGTASPSASLHVMRTDGTAKILIEEASSTNAVRTLMELKNKGAVNFRLTNTDVAGVSALWDYKVSDTGTSIISKVSSGVFEFIIAPGATGNTTIAGNLIVNGATGCTGCRDAQGTTVLDTDMLAKLNGLPFVKWESSEVADLTEGTSGKPVAASHISPDIAAFNKLYSLGNGHSGIAPLDVATVALAATQALNEQAQTHSAQIDSLQTQISTLQQENASLQARLAAIEAALNLPTPDTGSQGQSSIYVPSVQR